MYGRSNFSWRGTAGRGVCGLFAFEGGGRPVSFDFGQSSKGALHLGLNIQGGGTRQPCLENVDCREPPEKEFL